MGKDSIKIRKKFPGDMDPSTKIEKVKTEYSRKDNKRAIQDALSELEAENDTTDLDFEF